MARKAVIPLLLLTAFFAGFSTATIENPITQQMIQEAARLIGISIADRHTHAMQRTLESQRSSLEVIRAAELQNHTSPALHFRPFPVGFTPPQPHLPIKWQIPTTVELPTNLDYLAWYSIPELAYLIKHRKISVVSLTEIFLKRLEKESDSLRAVVTITRQRAMEQARLADAEIARGEYRGILHGIPYGAKDIFAVAGYPTTWGAEPFRTQFFESDATVIDKLDEAGAILIAKVSVGELAMGDVWFGGTTRNPWNLTQGSSGSSAGSASLVAAGFMPFSIGSETLGSIVSPSTRSGATGLRPTFGRVSRKGAMALSWSMDKIGPIARNAIDCAIVLEAIMGNDPLEPSTIDARMELPNAKDLKNLRIGFIREFFDADYANRENDQKVLNDLRSMGFTLHEVKWEIPLPVSALRIILIAEAAAAFDQITLSGRDSLLVSQGANAWPNIFRAARFIPAVEYINANRIRSKLIEQLHTIMQNYDVIVVPSFGGNQLLATNLTGHPSLVAPNGFDANGSPTSISFIGNLFEEGYLVVLADKWQQHTKHHTKRPPLFH
ncbi:MAG TPA: amidase [Bacteroidales bacterium]|nr:amidase [Bacteroidales bacterium]